MVGVARRDHDPFDLLHHQMAEGRERTSVTFAEIDTLRGAVFPQIGRDQHGSGVERSGCLAKTADDRIESDAVSQLDVEPVRVDENPRRRSRTYKGVEGV